MPGACGGEAAETDACRVVRSAKWASALYQMILLAVRCARCMLVTSGLIVMLCLLACRLADEYRLMDTCILAWHTHKSMKALPHASKPDLSAPGASSAQHRATTKKLKESSNGSPRHEKCQGFRICCTGQKRLGPHQGVAEKLQESHQSHHGVPGKLLHSHASRRGVWGNGCGCVWR